MEKFSLRITEYNIDLIDTFRRNLNKTFKDSVKDSVKGDTFTHVDYGEYDGSLELWGTGSPRSKEITTEEFIRFYNEKMGINQSIIHELW